MFNNAAIDIAIGLVFIYTLYSLLATTITELISTWINNRGKILKEGIERMLDIEPMQAKDSEDASKVNFLSSHFFERPEIKLLGRKRTNGKNKFPSYMSSKTFAKGLVNTLNSISNSAKTLDEVKAKLEGMCPKPMFLINMIEEADNNVDRFKTLAEEWFEECMDRVSGWYKKRIQLITFIVGLVIAFSMNVDTIAIAKKLSTDTKARLAMVELASTYVENMEAVDSLSESSSENIDSLNNRIQTIMTEIESSDEILSIPFPEPGNNAILFYIIGCILTALAMSFGSPFWFDLLNKLVKLRGAGTLPAAKNALTKKQPVG